MENFQKKFVLALLAYAVKRDLDPQALCRASGISYQRLCSRSAISITPEQTEALWKNAGLQSADPLFGLHYGESMQLAALGIIGQIIQTSTTVGEALTNAGALIGFITDLFQMKISHGKKTFTIYLLADQKKAARFPFTFRHLADYLMVFIIHEMDGLLLEKIEPLAVQLPYHLSDPYEYTRVFRSASIARGRELSLEFNAKVLQQPVLSANYELQEILLKKINALIKDSAGENDLQTRIYNYLLTNSYLNSFSQQAVASNFNISVRNLQRKLKEEGTSYQQIVEEVRKGLAINYLSKGYYQLKDIAQMLGYNEQPAFLRAFKRWTGKTPAHYRRDLK